MQSKRKSIIAICFFSAALPFLLSACGDSGEEEEANESVVKMVDQYLHDMSDDYQEVKLNFRNPINGKDCPPYPETCDVSEGLLHFDEKDENGELLLEFAVCYSKNGKIIVDYYNHFIPCDHHFILPGVVFDGNNITMTEWTVPNVPGETVGCDRSIRNVRYIITPPASGSYTVETRWYCFGDKRLPVHCEYKSICEVTVE